MRFRVRAYRTAAGRCPVREFLDECARSDPETHDFLVAGINKLRDRRYHREPVSKHLEEWGLYELRDVGSGARVFFDFRPGRLIVLLHAVFKKKRGWDKEPPRQAVRYRDDYLERCTGDEEWIDEQF